MDTKVLFNRNWYARQLAAPRCSLAGLRVVHGLADPESVPPRGWRPLESSVRLRFAVALAFLCCALELPSSGSTSPNHTVPNVSPPKGQLEFPARPTAEDFFRSHAFSEPLVPVGSQTSAAENAALAAALLSYSQRTSPDDFSSLTAFLEQHPGSAWRASLLTDLGLDYYNTAHYSLALEAWTKAWSLSQSATGLREKAVADRALGELAYMYARIGRMQELEALVQSVAGRAVVGPATERLAGAKAGLWNMQNRPGIAFRCGPLALRSIKLELTPTDAGDPLVYKSASTQRGFSLPQVAELSQRLGLNYQMAFRQKGSALVVPSVVHWKIGHYAAVVRQQGDRYLVKDPTFWSDVWATGGALDAEASGYFLVPAGDLPPGWRSVTPLEGEAVWGKGDVCCQDPGPTGPCDPHSGSGGGGSSSCDSSSGGDNCCKGMPVSTIHLSLVSLGLRDEPLGYTPPVGPPVEFKVRYNHRDAFQPSAFAYANFGPKWTCDLVSYITDNPFSLSANVQYYIMGGGSRTFTGFNPTNQTFASQQYDQTLLTRTGPNSYEMLWRNGRKLEFAQPDGSIGTSRNVFLTQIIDPEGNSLRLTYDAYLRLVAVTDAIGQVTTLSYQSPLDIYKVTSVTDPFGRTATFNYDAYGRLVQITDVIGLASSLTYSSGGDFVTALITPYGTNSYTAGQSGSYSFVEILYPDGNRERAEFNESTSLGIGEYEPTALIPTGMATHNDYIYYRNTYYWSKLANSLAYGDYTKAKIYHWLHTAEMASASGILESTKGPLENRVWYDYAGQTDPIVVGTINRPNHIGRVLDDGTTQLYAYQYDGFGHITNAIDPLGRTFSYLYSTNGIDLLQTLQTRAGNYELLSRSTYSAQHEPLTKTDAAGQTTSFSYNPRGQLSIITNALNQVTSFTYDTNGYLAKIHWPLPGTNDTTQFTYDAFGRMASATDSDGYSIGLAYDALDRLTRITYPDGTSRQFTYYLLDKVMSVDRAGRQTSFGYNSVREMVSRTDPLGRITFYQWCKCGDNKSVTDAEGRSTTWTYDVESRPITKQNPDGSQITYVYENTTSRVRQRIDEKLQVTQFSYNLDNTIRSIAYVNTAVPTPTVSYTYDRNYKRTTGITDGSGTTQFAYYPVTPTPTLGAGRLSTITGPIPGVVVNYGYDQLGRIISRTVSGVSDSRTFDANGRVVGETNALGAFTYVFEGFSRRLRSATYPNGDSTGYSYLNNNGDRRLSAITNLQGASVISEFAYAFDLAFERITNWLQQAGGVTPQIYSFSYDAADQLLGANVSSNGSLAESFAYIYDQAANRLSEQINSAVTMASYNALNQLTAQSGASASTATYEWDGANRLTTVNQGNQSTLFSYDAQQRLWRIQNLVSNVTVSDRWLVWAGHDLCEERTASGILVKRFYPQGVQVVSGAGASNFFYTRDHLGSVRELVDTNGLVAARFAYDPYGRRTQLVGSTPGDFGFTGQFTEITTGLGITQNRAYDPSQGRWLSRDPLARAEVLQGPNLYAYVGNNPINFIDPRGLQNVGPKAPPPNPGDPPPERCFDVLQGIYNVGSCFGCAAELANALKNGDWGGFETGGNFCSTCLSDNPGPWGPCPPPEPVQGSSCEDDPNQSPCVPQPNMCMEPDGPQPSQLTCH